jgi:ribosomal protein S18 acetylase RimI-like enzyme
VCEPSPGQRPEGVEAELAPAVEGDLDVLGALQARVRGGDAGEWARRVRKAMGRPRGAVVVARVGDAVVGYGSVAYLAEHAEDGAPGGFYLTGVTVDLGWRRRGVGEQLTRWRMEWAWRQAAGELWCLVSARNPASIELHRGLGFREVRRAPALQGVPFDGGEGLLMRAQRPS